MMLVTPIVLAQAAQIAPLTADVERELRARIAGLPGAVIVIARRDGAATRIDTIAGANAPKADGNTLFEIGSITKTVTGALFADALRAGTVTLDEPLGALLTGATVPAYAGRTITLADLAEQRSGLPPLPPDLTSSMAAADPYAGITDAQVFGSLQAFTLTRAPGSRYEYSNWGFALLGDALAARAHESYAQLAATKIFAPLGMTSTTAGVERDGELIPAFLPDGTAQPPWHLSAFAGAGAIRSTANDLVRYSLAFDGGGGVAGADVRDAALPRADVPGGARIGFAWMTQPDGIVWHNGGTGGFRSFLGVLPAAHRSVVVLTNVGGDGNDDVAMHLLDPSVPMRTTTVVDPAELQRYAGTYELAPGAVVTIVSTVHGLTAQLTGQPAYPIFPAGANHFVWHVVVASLDFQVDAGGRVTGATLHQNGQNLPMKRITQ